MSKATNLEERVWIGELARVGLTDVEIARRVGWSPVTVRKWRRCGQRQGHAGLASRIGRPTCAALSTFPPQMRAELRVWRKAHPGRGAKTLRAELEEVPDLAGQVLPHRSSIARWLKEKGLTRTPVPRRFPPACICGCWLWASC